MKPKRVSRLAWAAPGTVTCRDKGQAKAADAAEVADDETREEEEPRVKRPRRTQDRKVDPFAIPPSGCDGTVFSIQQPFVDVFFHEDIRQSMRGDKVLDGKSMDAETLKAAINEISKEYILAMETSHAPASELAYRDLHVALIKSFWWLTRPRAVRTKENHELRALAKRKLEKPSSSPEEIRELNVEVDARNTITSEPKDPLSSDSLDVRLEGDEGEGEEKALERPKYDIKCQVYDERIDGIDKSVVVLLVECKWGSLAVEDIFQVAAYGCDVIKKNLQKGSFSPLHLEVWNENCWRYAVLFPLGLVVVQDQNIVEVKGSEISKQLLKAQLDDRKTNDKYSGFEYPDGEYLDGMLFVSNKSFSLPGRDTKGSLVNGDSRLFYQSKLRILVGEKVLNWTLDDVKSAVKDRDEALREKHAMLMDG